MPMRYLRRAFVYGTMAAVFVAPIASKLGYERAVVDIEVNNAQQSCLEKIANDRYSVINPDDHQRYIIDFNEQKIVRYQNQSQIKQLDDIFGGN